MDCFNDDIGHSHNYHHHHHHHKNHHTHSTKCEHIDAIMDDLQGLTGCANIETNNNNNYGNDNYGMNNNESDNITKITDSNANIITDINDIKTALYRPDMVYISSRNGKDSIDANGSITKPFASIIYALTRIHYAESPSDKPSDFIDGTEYRIDTLGDTDWTSIGASSNPQIGDKFIKNSNKGNGSGTASPPYLNDPIIFSLESGIYNESPIIDLNNRRKIIITSGSEGEVILRGNITVTFDYIGPHMFVLMGRDIECDKSLTLDGTLCLSPTINNSSFQCVISNCKLLKNIISVVNCTLTLNHDEMKTTDNSISYIFSSSVSILPILNVMNSTIKSIICGCWNLSVFENVIISKIDYSVDLLGNKYDGKIVGNIGYEYVGGFRNCRFDTKGNKFGTDTISTNYINFDANSFTSLTSVGDISFNNIIIGFIDDVKGISYTPNDGLFVSSPSSTENALNRIASVLVTLSGGNPIP